jgi:hypothetical protein
LNRGYTFISVGFWFWCPIKHQKLYFCDFWNRKNYIWNLLTKPNYLCQFGE